MGNGNGLRLSVQCSICFIKLGQQQWHSFLDFVLKVCPWFPEEANRQELVEELAPTPPFSAEGQHSSAADIGESKQASYGLRKKC